MNCYVCERSQHPGGTLFHVREAVGVCLACGVGVCLEHGKKPDEEGGRFLCAGCRRLEEDQSRRTA
jgi:hypothetical protein